MIENNLTFDYSLEHIFSYTATVINPPEIIGIVPEGIRINYYITGGEVKGTKLNGKVLPVGGNWGIIRTDGVSIVDLRYTFETNDGALIYSTCSGVLDLGEDGYQRFLKQEEPPEYAQVRITPRYHTAHPEYQWLNRVQCLGIGQTDMKNSQVHYNIYLIR